MEMKQPKNLQTRDGAYEVVGIIDNFKSQFGENSLVILKRKSDGVHVNSEYFFRNGAYFFYSGDDNDDMDIIPVPEEKLYAWDIRSAGGAWFRVYHYLTEDQVHARFPASAGYVAIVRGPEFTPPK